jgi:hypothetical protein
MVYTNVSIVLRTSSIVEYCWLLQLPAVHTLTVRSLETWMIFWVNILFIHNKYSLYSSFDTPYPPLRVHRHGLCWCLDDPSTHKLTTRQFDPHLSSSRQTVCCDNLLLWHSSTYKIRPRIFCLPWLQGGRFVTCDITSTLPKVLCDIMFTLSWSKIWTVCHNIFVWTHLWCPAICLATCGCFVTGFLPTCLWCPASFSAKCGRFVTW